MQNVQPATVSTGDSFRVTIRIVNSGKESILIPTSRRLSEVVRTGNENQRLMHIELRMDAMGSMRRFAITAAVAAGSDSVPGTLLQLAPGDSALIVCKTTLAGTEMERQQRTELVDLRVRATVFEGLLEQEQYRATGHTVEVTSGNFVSLNWRL